MDNHLNFLPYLVNLPFKFKFISISLASVTAIIVSRCFTQTQGLTQNKQQCQGKSLLTERILCRTRLMGGFLLGQMDCLLGV